MQALSHDNHGKCYQLPASPASSTYDLVTLTQSQITFNGIQHEMLMVKNVTSVMLYEQLKMENHFYELITATVSHDMRTPLNAMIGLLSNLKQYVGEQGQKYLQIIVNSSQFMLYLVNDLLDLYQIKNGKLRKHEDVVDLRHGINELLDMFQLGAHEKGIRLVFECEEPFPEQVVADEKRIKQVILNLLQNALKFTLEGTITVKAGYRNGMLKVSVSDTGIGIAEEDKDKLFKVFGVAEKNAATLNTQGVGLGLSICKQIVEAFDGSICLEDDAQKGGTTFTFQLKCPSLSHDKFESEVNLVDDTDECVMNESNSSLRLMIQQECDLNGKNSEFMTRKEPIRKQQCVCESQSEILVVDDNIFNLVTFQSILSLQFGVKSDKALNGKHALTLFTSRLSLCPLCKSCKPYKLIFMDCNMPVMDGMEATVQIRRLETRIKGGPIVRIVALTAYENESIKRKCLEAGMDAHLSKPVQTHELQLILNSYSNNQH